MHNELEVSGVSAGYGNAQALHDVGLFDLAAGDRRLASVDGRQDFHGRERPDWL